MLWQVTIASISLINTMFSKKHSIHNGFIEYNIADNLLFDNPSFLYLFSCSLTLTPGTIVTKINDKSIIINYALDTNDKTAITKSIKSFETSLAKALFLIPLNYNTNL